MAQGRTANSSPPAAARGLSRPAPLSENKFALQYVVCSNAHMVIALRMSVNPGCGLGRAFLHDLRTACGRWAGPCPSGTHLGG